MYRAVLAVVLASALLGVTMPALEDARRDRASVAVENELDRLRATANQLDAVDDPTAGPGARRSLTIDLPARQWTSARIDRLTLHPETADSPGRASWQVAGGRTVRRALPELSLRTPAGEPLSLSGPGTHELTLTLDGQPGSSVVTVRRLKYDNEANPRHARVVHVRDDIDSRLFV